MPSSRKLLRTTGLASVAAAAALVAAALLPGAALAAETGGSGGSYSDRTSQSFTASNGLSSQYHVYASGVPQGEATGLVLQFHGDGAYEFNNPNSTYSLGGSNGIVSKARERGYITVPVLSPDKQGSVTWWESGAQNAKYVADLLASLKSQYNIDTEDIWLVGYSGGAQFVTQFYLPAYSSTIDGGGAVVFGGGGVPRVSAQPFASGFVSDFPMHWYTGANDTGPGYNALRDAQNGSSWYSQKGFETDLETPAGVGHSLSGKFGGVLAGHLDAHEPNSSTVPPSTTTPPTTSTPPATTTPPTTTPPTTPPTTTTPPTSTKPPTTTPPTSTTPPVNSSLWPMTLTPSSTGATVDIEIPRGTKKTTFRVETTNGRGYWYTYTTGTGDRTLQIRSSLQPGTTYNYTIVADGKLISSGSFTTSR